MYVSFLEPHPPWTGPYDGIHDPQQVPIEPTFLKRPDGHSLFSRVRADFFMQSDLHTPDDVDDSEWEKGRAEYNALDKAIGRQFDLKPQSGSRLSPCLGADNPAEPGDRAHGKILSQARLVADRPGNRGSQ